MKKEKGTGLLIQDPEYCKFNDKKLKKNKYFVKHYLRKVVYRNNICLKNNIALPINNMIRKFNGANVFKL